MRLLRCDHSVTRRTKRLIRFLVLGRLECVLQIDPLINYVDGGVTWTAWGLQAVESFAHVDSFERLS